MKRISAIRIWALAGLLWASSTVIIFDSCWAEDVLPPKDSLEAGRRGPVVVELTSWLSESGKAEVLKKKQELQSSRKTLSEKTKKLLEIKDKGDIKIQQGGQDLGGGDANEARFIMVAQSLIAKMALHIDSLEKARVLTRAELSKMEHAVQQMQVVTSSATTEGVKPFEVRIEDGYWDEVPVLTFVIKELDTLRALMSFAGVEGDKIMHRAQDVLRLITSQKESIVRVDLIAKVDGKYQMQINLNPNDIRLGEIRKTESGRLRLGVPYANEIGGGYDSNPDSPIFRFKACTSPKSLSPSDLWDPLFFYSQFAKTSQACHDKLSRGKIPKTFWVSQRDLLILLCSEAVVP